MSPRCCRHILSANKQRLLFPSSSLVSTTRSSMRNPPLQLACVGACWSSSVAAAANTTTSAADRVSSTTLKDRIRGAYYGALVADALCLGSHYEYDASKIKQAYGGAMIQRYMAAGEQMGGETHGIGWGARNYHPGTIAGDQTDYGEYNVLILEHLATSASSPHAFDVAELLPTWKHRLVHGWKQWVCTQTKQTYKQVTSSTSIPVSQLGGNSNAMALRFAAVFSYYETEDAVVDAALKTMFTHRETTALRGGEFFARVTYRILHHSLTPRQAIDQVAAESDPWIQRKVAQAIAKVDEARKPPLAEEEFVDDLALTSMAKLWDVGRSEPIKVGKASPTEGTLPGAIYFILKYPDDLVLAAKANAMVGGDNASRAIAIGMVLGAAHGVLAGIPQELKDGLNHWKHSEALLETMPLLVTEKTTSTVADEL
jgi:ADP-ribosylglycohydrolase